MTLLMGRKTHLGPFLCSPCTSGQPIEQARHNLVPLHTCMHHWTSSLGSDQSTICFNFFTSL